MPKKLTCEDQLARADDMETRSALKRHAAKRAWLSETLDQNPHHVDAMVEKLQALVRLSKAPVMTEGGAKAKPAKDIGWLRQYNKYVTTPSRLLSKLLYKLNRIVFSPTNLKALLKPGQKEVDKVLLAHLLEYCTDRDAYLLIDIVERDLDVQLELVERDAKPERYADLALGEDDFETNMGIYESDDRRGQEGGVWLKRRHIQEPWRMINKTFVGALEFAQNYSTTKAVIKSSGGTVFPCVLLFGLNDDEGCRGDGGHCDGCACDDKEHRDGDAAGGTVAADMGVGSAARTIASGAGRDALEAPALSDDAEEPPLPAVPAKREGFKASARPRVQKPAPPPARAQQSSTKHDVILEVANVKAEPRQETAPPPADPQTTPAKRGSLMAHFQACTSSKKEPMPKDIELQFQPPRLKRAKTSAT